MSEGAWYYSALPRTWGRALADNHEVTQALADLEARLTSALELKLNFYFSYCLPTWDPGSGRIFIHTKDNQHIYLDQREPFISTQLLETQEWVGPRPQLSAFCHEY